MKRPLIPGFLPPLFGLCLLPACHLQAKDAYEIASTQILGPRKEMRSFRGPVLKEAVTILQPDFLARQSIEDQPGFRNFHDTLFWAAARRVNFDQTEFARQFPALYAYGRVVLVTRNYSAPLIYVPPAGFGSPEPRVLYGDADLIRPTAFKMIDIKGWRPRGDVDWDAGSYSFMDGLDAGEGANLYLCGTFMGLPLRGAKMTEQHRFWYRINDCRLIPDHRETYAVPRGKEKQTERRISVSYPSEPLMEPPPEVDSGGNASPAPPPEEYPAEDASPSSSAGAGGIVSFWIPTRCTKSSGLADRVLQEVLPLIKKDPALRRGIEEHRRFSEVSDRLFWAAARSVSFDREAFIRAFPNFFAYGKVLLVSAKSFDAPRIIYQGPGLSGALEPRMLYGNSAEPELAKIGTPVEWSGEKDMDLWNGHWYFRDTRKGPYCYRVSIGRMTHGAKASRHILYWLRMEATQLTPERGEGYMVPPGGLRSAANLENVSYATKTSFDFRRY